MSHFECHLNRRFWRSKKVVQIWERGRGIIWTKSKRTAAFFRDPFPIVLSSKSKVMYLIYLWLESLFFAWHQCLDIVFLLPTEVTQL